MNPFEQQLLSCCLDHQVVGKKENRLEVEAELLFPASFIGFKGHFPTRPILPAIIQLAMIRLLTEQTLTHRLFPNHYGKTKFRRIIEPEQKIMAELKLTLTEETVDCQFQLKQPDGQVISEGSCIFVYL